MLGATPVAGASSLTCLGPGGGSSKIGLSWNTYSCLGHSLVLYILIAGFWEGVSEERVRTARRKPCSLL